MSETEHDGRNVEPMGVPAEIKTGRNEFLACVAGFLVLVVMVVSGVAYFRHRVHTAGKRLLESAPAAQAVAAQPPRLQVYWSQTQAANVEQHGTNRVLLLGFRNDGVVVWRMAPEGK